MAVDKATSFTAQFSSTSAALLVHATLLVLFYAVTGSEGLRQKRLAGDILIESLPVFNQPVSSPVVPKKIPAVKSALEKLKPGILPAKTPSPRTGGQSGSIAPVTGNSPEKIIAHGTGEGNPANRGTGEGTGTGTGSGIASPGTDYYRVGVENAPEAFGGVQGIVMKIPSSAISPAVSGKSIYVTAFIDEEGIVRKAQLSKGTGEPVDGFAVAAVKRTRFKPGKDKGRIVKVQLMLNLRLP